MSDCRFCKALRFWLKLLTLISITATGYSFAYYLDKHQIAPKYQEPLSTKQQVMKDGYLAKRQIPEILTAKDGTTIYYQSSQKVASTERPAWLSEESKIKLEKWQEETIAYETIVTEEILGTKFKPMTVSDFNMAAGAIAMLAFTGSVFGIVWSFGIRNGERLSKNFLIFIAIWFIAFYFLSFNLFAVCAKTFVAGLLIGLSIYPLWAFIDYVTVADYDNQKTA